MFSLLGVFFLCLFSVFQKRVFYFSETILFEVWEGPGSRLFRVVFLDPCI